MIVILQLHNSIDIFLVSNTKVVDVFYIFTQLKTISALSYIIIYCYRTVILITIRTSHEKANFSI